MSIPLARFRTSFEHSLIYFCMPLGYPHADQQAKYCNYSTVPYSESFETLSTGRDTGMNKKDPDQKGINRLWIISGGPL
jgi:hypothetical protein